jgi:DDE superfamily endonuclease
VQRVIDGFAFISYDKAIRNCALAIDGYLLRIKVPDKFGVGNVRSYFSGHYQCYGVNVQAGCDHHSRFVYLAFASPGVTADRYAIKHCCLHELIESLPFGICAIRDAAYKATKHSVPICHSIDRLKERNDDFNFYASQLRIRIEMAFGIMQMKWGVLQCPVKCKLANAKDLVQAMGRLHNFVINERLIRLGIADDAVGGGYMPSVPHDADGDPVNVEALFSGLAHRGYSEQRERMADRVEALGLKGPFSNRLKRRHYDI